MAFDFLKKPSKKTSAPPLDQKTYQKFLVKATGFINAHAKNRKDFVPPEFDLEEIKRASSADSYIKMALMKYSYLIYKAGYQYKSEKDETINYLTSRFNVMSLCTRKPMDILFQEIADDLVKYSNAFLIKSRGDILFPGIKAKGVFDEKPVLGYFRIDPVTIKIKRDKHGTVLGYEQETDDGETKTFKPTDIIHFYLDKDANNAFGTPRIMSALEDVKLLRTLEGNIVALVYRFAMPIFHWKIGLPQAGGGASETEIREARREVEDMAMDGMIFTNERTDIKAIGAEGNALDATGYLAYFEKRVFTALGVSESQMGRGGSKQDADSMEAQVHDTVKYIQRTMSTFIENYILMELLLEGGFNPVLNLEDQVSYIFNEISLETKVKVENHEMLKYQSNLVSIDEARTNMGMRTDFDENKLYAHFIDEKVAISQQDNAHINSLETLDKTQKFASEQQDKQLKTQNTALKQDSSSAKKENGNGKSKSATSKNKDVENRNRPANQYGKTSAKIKESFDIEEAKKSFSIKDHKKSYDSIYKNYINLRNDITENNADIDLVFPLVSDSIRSDIKGRIDMAALEGAEKAYVDISLEDKGSYPVPASKDLTEFYKEIDRDVKGIFKDLKQRVGECSHDKTQVCACFDSLEYRLRFLLEYIPRKAYWYSYIKTAEANDIEEVYVRFNSEKDEAQYPSVIDTKVFDIKDIPAYHSFCNCSLSLRKQVK